MQYLSAIDSVDHQNVSAGGVRGTARQQHERGVLFQLLEIRSSCSSRWSEGVSGRLCTVRTPLQLTMTMPACLYAAHTAVLCARSHGSGRRSKHWISAIVRAHRRTGEARVPLSMCARTLDAPAKSSHGAAGGGSGDTVCATLRPLAPHALAQLPPRQQAACVAGAVAHDAVDARAALAELWRASTSAAAIARRTSGRSGASTKACRSSRRASSQSWRTVRKKDP